MIATCTPLVPSHSHCHYTSNSNSNSSTRTCTSTSTNSANELKRKLFSPAVQAGSIAASASAQAQSANMSSQQELHHGQDAPLEPKRKGARGIGGSSSGCLQGSSAQSNLPQPPPKRRKKMPDPTQVADWFAKMVCYIWLAPAAPAQATRPGTPVQQSPLASYAPLHHQMSGDGSPQLAAFGGSFSDAALRPSSSPGVSAAGTTVHTFQPAFADQQAASVISDANARFAAELVRRGAPLDHSRSFASASAAGLGAHQARRISSMARLKPQAKFISFARELLSTTQLSTSVILLAL